VLDPGTPLIMVTSPDLGMGVPQVGEIEENAGLPGPSTLEAKTASIASGPGQGAAHPQVSPRLATAAASACRSSGEVEIAETKAASERAATRTSRARQAGRCSSFFPSVEGFGVGACRSRLPSRPLS